VRASVGAKSKMIEQKGKSGRSKPTNGKGPAANSARDGIKAEERTGGQGVLEGDFKALLQKKTNKGQDLRIKKKRSGNHGNRCVSNASEGEAGQRKENVQRAIFLVNSKKIKKKREGKKKEEKGAICS